MSKAEVIKHVREKARELSDLCADHRLVRLETLLWATEQQALLDSLIDAAEQPEIEAETPAQAGVAA